MKLAFVREPGQGQPAFAGARQLQEGAAIIVSVPSQPELVTAPGVTQWTPNGLFDPHPIPARPPYIGTVHATSVRAWQSGWATSWEDINIRPQLVPSLYGHFNVLAQGKVEPFPATVYQAGPSLGQVAPKMI